MLTHVLTLVPRAGAFETMPTLNSVNCEKMNQFCLRDTYTVNKWPDILSLRLGCYRDLQLVTRPNKGKFFFLVLLAKEILSVIHCTLTDQIFSKDQQTFNLVRRKKQCLANLAGSGPRIDKPQKKNFVVANNSPFRFLFSLQ